MNGHPCLNTKPRVLIVDNNERIRNMYQELATHWGFTPVLAYGVGNALLEDAKRQAREQRCQLAVIDLRLIDDLDDEDVSGLKLVPEIEPAVSIIVSASVDIENIRRSDEIGAASYVGKGEGPAVLKEKVEREARKLCASWKGIVIEPSDILEEIAGILCEKVAAEYHDQITDIFVRLFPNAGRLRLEKMGADSAASTYSTVPRPKSVILKVYENNKQPVIVKVARARKMSIEFERYRTYIQGYLKGYFHPLLSNPVILWDIGGAIYTSLGSTDSRTFSRFYSEASFADIEYSLRRFFCETWSPLYASPKECKNVSLFREYVKVWGKEWYERVRKFHAPEVQAVMQNKLPKHIFPINPLTWLQEKMGEAAEENDASITKSTALAVTHGDLHGDNLLIDDHRNAWVIDFERSGEGHILQDFVELEGDLINRLSARENLPSFYQLCIDVTRSIELEPLENLDRFEDAEVKKSMQTISLLRRLAREVTGLTDARQYLLGLLFNTLFRATIIGESAQTLSQHRALMLASILCHRLEHWNEPWPPEEWKDIMKEGSE